MMENFIRKSVAISLGGAILILLIFIKLYVVGFHARQSISLQRVDSENQMKQIACAVEGFRDDHPGRRPKDIGDIRQYAAAQQILFVPSEDRAKRLECLGTEHQNLSVASDYRLAVLISGPIVYERPYLWGDDLVAVCFGLPNLKDTDRPNVKIYDDSNLKIRHLTVTSLEQLLKTKEGATK